MTQQPEALRLADALDGASNGPLDFKHKAAAELRRLHAENEQLRATLAASCEDQRQELYESGPGGGCYRALQAEKTNAQLLEALESIAKNSCCDRCQEAALVARAAIAAARGQA